MGCEFNLSRLLLVIAVIALIVGLIFHIIYLVSDRENASAQDEYNKNQSELFYLLAVATGIVGLVLGAANLVKLEM